MIKIKVQWPVTINNGTARVKISRAKLIFLDNVYMYGKLNGA